MMFTRLREGKSGPGTCTRQASQSLIQPLAVNEIAQKQLTEKFPS
jgi:hypothetical protein